VTGSDDIGGDRLTLLARAGEVLSSPGAAERTLERLAALLAAGFADWCAIDVLDGAGAVTRVACAPGDVMPGIGSSLCVPLISRDRPWGTITLVRAGDERRFTEADRDTAAELARRAAGAVETSQLLQSLAQSEERLAQAEKMEAIGRLAGGVAHDFNNLLMVISGYAELLLAKGEVPGREQLGQIAYAAEQASGLTRQLLAFSRRQVLHPRVLDLNEIVAGMEPMLRRIIGADVSVGVRLAPGLAPVEADRAQLERVIVNLAANARDAMPRGGRLTIETANADGPSVLLAICDTGVGMSEDVRRHLFEPFFTTKPPGAGTGLGLSTVFGVVKQSGGSIDVESEENRGTTFKIYLPAAAERAEEPEADDRAADRGSETIMVVEDDESVRDLVRVMLESRGYTVLAAATGAEAERIYCNGGVDLVLTDVVMPDLNGRELAERLSLASASMRILFMSGYADEAVRRHGEIARDASFIEKPFTDRALARKVREVLDA
jgi:two-component system, cell cycle sensor histidine kinase and response regulator CckA